MAEVDDELARAQSRIGSVLRGKYRLDRVLGVGGMAVVYGATHVRNANRVAVKVLHRELSVDAGLRARFLREGYAANTVEHPGTVRVLDDDIEADGTVFLVMELLDGETLERRWERNYRRLGLAEVVTIVADLLDVLIAAHDKGIVHRDIKPENLFVTRDTGLRILDFGVARLRDSSPTRTKSGAVFGTPAFMPPEQALGRTKEVDALSDIWAVGATAFTLLTGRYVHSGETAEEMLVRAATQPAPSLKEVEPSVPELIANVIDRALAFDRSARWPSAGEMRTALIAARDLVIVGAGNDDYTEDPNVMTRVAPPPSMTLRPKAGGATTPMAGAATLPLPTLPAVSTIAGVVSTGARRMAFHRRTTALVAVIAAAASALVVVVIFVGLEISRSHESMALLPAVSGVAAPVEELAREIGSNITAPPAQPPAAAPAAPTAIAIDNLPPTPPVPPPPTAPVATAPAAPVTTAPQAPAPPARTATAAPAPTTAVSKPPSLPSNPYCNPPYDIVNGIRRWKKACL